MVPIFVTEMPSVAALMGPDGRGCGCFSGGAACLPPVPLGWAPPAQPASQALPRSAPSPRTVSRRVRDVAPTPGAGLLIVDSCSSRHATVLKRSPRGRREPQVLAVGDVHDVVVPAQDLRLDEVLV